MKKIEIEIVEDPTGFTMNCHHDDTHATSAEVMFWNATVDLIQSVNKFGNDLDRAGKAKVHFPIVKWKGGAK